MRFRRTYKISQLSFRSDVANMLTFQAGHASLQFRPSTQQERAENPNMCWADVMLDARAKAHIAAMFAEIRHNRLPQGEEILQSILLAKQGVPYQQQSWVMMESMPQAFQDYVKSIRERMQEAVVRFTHLIRWRASLYGPPDSIDWRGPLEWSDDEGTTWHLMPFVPQSHATGVVSLAYDQERHDEIQRLYDRGLSEPPYREIFREAVHLQESSRRSALILAVAAAEIGVKTIIDDLDPAAGQQLDNQDALPAVSLLRDRLPKLPVRNSVQGAVVIPSHLLDVLEKAVHARNRLLHHGADPLTVESLIEKVNAIRDLLLLLDYYRGSDWSFEQMTEQSKRDALALAAAANA